MINTPTDRPLTTPGEILKEEFLEPMGLSQKQLAENIGVSYQKVNELIHGKRSITISTALRLAQYFNTSPEFWLNLQRANDMHRIFIKEREQIDRIQPIVST